MRICVHIGPDAATTDRLQRVLDGARAQMLAQGVLYARSPGARNHTRIFMAVNMPAEVDSLRHIRGFATPEKQQQLHDAVARELTAEVRKTRPKTLILSAHQFGTSLPSRPAIKRLRDLLRPLSDDIRIVAHMDEPARLVVRRYAAQVFEGRSRGLDLELGMTNVGNWWDAALATCPAPDPRRGQFPDVQGASHWLDLPRLVAEWDAVFGIGATHLRSRPFGLYSADIGSEVRDAFDLGFAPIAEQVRAPIRPSAAWLARARQFNEAVQRFLTARPDFNIPRPLWRTFLTDMKVTGTPIDPGHLALISQRFARDITQLATQHPGLDVGRMTARPGLCDWTEADPKFGFRATQYLLAFQPRIRAAKPKRPDQAKTPQMPSAPKATCPPPNTQDRLPPLARQNLLKLQGSTLAPHNRLGQVNEATLGQPYVIRARQIPPPGSTGTVIVACMKNEAPYILEWIAYHRAIGVDTFLIYTNDCDDGTAEILGRLQQLGLVEHRNNDTWRGKSPQQYALNHARDEPVIRNADWIIHIDVDEFINVRCGNGTLDDFRARVPDATNVAMTWRLFGHNGVLRLADDLVIDQFDGCAPTYCPKPHTVWGFKTMFRNIGAYTKMSCHRPNKLNPEFTGQVKWVNGSGTDMTSEAQNRGWRNSRKSIGYDLLQLNHYALRSAEAYLIKRQRGRALHVDRTIGLNYWIRMDWSTNHDVTIKRNIPRLRTGLSDLLADDTLHGLHRRGCDWHHAKAHELHAMPEFEDLYQQALALRLSETERVAYALALDTQS
ncbi:glycosyltransferase family 2 protein [Puniceibacterium sp. IMCC21224]|uniref:glycosyltransferase family 2 protein n=1 Tax=Puniceibacterium sp. IMCC21224 TaxID=1618204 RepID=UPI00064D95B3|nr:glycosyltransferase family 2 protein [Puniceibacterium sp. IMCC21224]KMK67332.1 Glycosyl transferase family 2 [Puniceibacterium sp. IMCC21224]